jgi:hypothetical protein
MLSSCSDSNSAPGPLVDETTTPMASPTPIEAGEGLPGTPADRGEVFNGNGPSTVYDPAAPETLTVVLYGSSGCPPEPVSYTVGDDGKVTILTAYTGEPRACNENLAPITYEIETPPEFDPNKGIAITSNPTDQN